MAVTLTQATAQVTLWEAASTAVGLGQSYTIGDRTLTRVHAAEVREMITYWSRLEAQLTRRANGEMDMSISRAKFS